MSWLQRNLPWLLLAFVVIFSLSLAGVVGVGILVVFAGLLGGASIAATLGNASLFLGAAVVLAALDVATLLAFVITVIRRARLPKSERLSETFARMENLVPPLRALELSERFEPPIEERKARIEEQYVEGEIGELEFERRLQALLREEEADRPTVEDIERELAATDHKQAARERTEGDAESPSGGREREREREPEFE